MAGPARELVGQLPRTIEIAVTNRPSRRGNPAFVSPFNSWPRKTKFVEPLRGMIHRNWKGEGPCAVRLRALLGGVRNRVSQICTHRHRPSCRLSFQQPSVKLLRTTLVIGGPFLGLPVRHSRWSNPRHSSRATPQSIWRQTYFSKQTLPRCVGVYCSASKALGCLPYSRHPYLTEPLSYTMASTSKDTS
jgi:hypothetical protein